jgi:hypothetical protein
VQARLATGGARAQQGAAIPVIGYLGSTASALTPESKKGLQETGSVEGENLA